MPCERGRKVKVYLNQLLGLREIFRNMEGGGGCIYNYRQKWGSEVKNPRDNKERGVRPSGRGRKSGEILNSQRRLSEWS